MLQKFRSPPRSLVFSHTRITPLSTPNAGPHTSEIIQVQHGTRKEGTTLKTWQEKKIF